jgi:WXG100 family type VII secretion target
MAEFFVTSATLEAKAAELESFNNDLKNLIDQLGNNEEALSGMWEGEARNAFHAAFGRDKNQVYAFYNAIASYVNALRTIAKEYNKAEATNVQTATRRTY